MEKDMRAIIVAVVLGLLASGSAHAADDVVQLTQDTYMITRISRAGIFASMANLKNGVIKDASAFAASKGKVAVPSNQEVTTESPGKTESSQQRDTYTELLKLDDLRKKGIITDAEFESEKQKILTGNQ